MIEPDQKLRAEFYRVGLAVAVEAMADWAPDPEVQKLLRQVQACLDAGDAVNG